MDTTSHAVSAETSAHTRTSSNGASRAAFAAIALNEQRKLDEARELHATQAIQSRPD